MGGVTAVVIVGVVLVLTLLVGIGSQMFGRRRATVRHEPAPPSPSHGPTAEQQEDLDAVNKGIEEARTELLWLREQIGRERDRLERLRRQGPRPAPNQDPAAHGPAGPRMGQQPPLGQAHGQRPAAQAPSADNPWVILGLKPGSSADDIRRRYRLLSRVWHPDRFIDGPPELRAEAEVMMARLNRAHNALTSQAAGLRR